MIEQANAWSRTEELSVIGILYVKSHPVYLYRAIAIPSPKRIFAQTPAMRPMPPGYTCNQLPMRIIVASTLLMNQEMYRSKLPRA